MLPPNLPQMFESWFYLIYLGLREVLGKSMTSILFVIELVHVLMHSYILYESYIYKERPNSFMREIREIWQFKESPELEKRLYFFADLLSSLLTYCFFGNIGGWFYTSMVIFHAVIHTTLQVFWGSQTFRNIIDIAQGDYRKHDTLRLFYVLGTIQDITTHSINVYILFGVGVSW